MFALAGNGPPCRRRETKVDCQKAGCMWMCRWEVLKKSPLTQKFVLLKISTKIRVDNENGTTLVEKQRKREMYGMVI